MTKINHGGDYAEKRRAAYPDIGDQLGALWEAIGAKKLPPDAEAIRARIDDVKRRYPKGAK